LYPKKFQLWSGPVSSGAKPLVNKVKGSKVNKAVPRKGSNRKSNNFGLGQFKSQLEAMAAELKVLKGESSSKIKLLKADTGEKFVYHLDKIPLENFKAKHSIFLDCGASRHVAPVELQIHNIEQVNTPLLLLDATNNQTPIKLQGDFEHDVGGKIVNFSKVLVLDKATDVLISVSQWLAGTEDRIVLTAGSAFYQAAGSKDCHEIAKVVNGMYCMNPLATITEPMALAATVDLLGSTSSGDKPSISVFSVERRYSKVLALASHEDMEAVARQRGLPEPAEEAVSEDPMIE
ncbi:hypothetical protein HDU82_003374, partial [Entophlyctis luteolus]